MSGCPVNHGRAKTDPNPNDLDPATQMPPASVLEAGSASDLPTDRQASTIPRTAPDGSGGTWLYPSPRMFYNALQRKGKPADPSDIPVMVDIHNFLNERVWEEILQWEGPHKGICPGPTLKRFMGRPEDLSPRAWFYHNIYRGPRPFDRHDWVVDRCGQEVRYVIDYYSGATEGEFSVDVRPALDTPSALIDRIRMAYRRWTHN